MILKKHNCLPTDLFQHSHELLDGMPRQEFHIHTNFSDGKNSVEEFVEKAIVEKYNSICFTEHVDFTTDWFYEYVKTVKLNKRTNNDLNIYCGVEVRAKDFKGNLNSDINLLKDSEIVMGVVHRIPSEDGLNVRDPTIFSSDELLELEYAATLGLLRNNLVKILGHPMSNYEKLFNEVPEDMFIEIFELAKRKKVAIELNPAYIRNFSKFLELNMEFNTLISLGSNAHSLKDFGMAFNQVRRLLER